MLGGEILIQRAAKSCVDKLNSAADAENGFVLLQSEVQQLQFHVISGLAGSNQTRQRKLMVEFRADIVTAGKKKTGAQLG